MTPNEAKRQYLRDDLSALHIARDCLVRCDEADIFALQPYFSELVDLATAESEYLLGALCVEYAVRAKTAQLATALLDQAEEAWHLSISAPSKSDLPRPATFNAQYQLALLEERRQLTISGTIPDILDQQQNLSDVIEIGMKARATFKEADAPNTRRQAKVILGTMGEIAAFAMLRRYELRYDDEIDSVVMPSLASEDFGVKKSHARKHSPGWDISVYEETDDGIIMPNKLQVKVGGKRTVQRNNYGKIPIVHLQRDLIVTDEEKEANASSLDRMMCDLYVADTSHHEDLIEPLHGTLDERAGIIRAIIASATERNPVAAIA